MQQIPHQEPTNTRYDHTKFSCTSTLAPQYMCTLDIHSFLLSSIRATGGSEDIKKHGLHKSIPIQTSKFPNMYLTQDVWGKISVNLGIN